MKIHPLLKLAGLGFVVVLLTLAVSFVGLASMWGGICETVVHAAVAAPGEHQKAWVYGADCGAVASVTTTTVAIGAPTDVQDPREDDQATPLFRARVDRSSPLRVSAYGPAVSVRWVSDSALTIGYDRHVEVLLAVLRTHGITVTYDTLP